MVKCPKCGKELPEESKFCPYCMHILNIRADYVNGNNKNKVKWYVWITISAFICAVIVFLFIYGNTVRNDKNTPTESDTYYSEDENIQSDDNNTLPNTPSNSDTSSTTEIEETTTTQVEKPVESLTTESTEAETTKPAPKPTEAETTKPAPKPTEAETTKPATSKPTEAETTQPATSKPTEAETTQPATSKPTEAETTQSAEIQNPQLCLHESLNKDFCNKLTRCYECGVYVSNKVAHKYDPVTGICAECYDISLDRVSEAKVGETFSIDINNNKYSYITWKNVTVGNGYKFVEEWDSEYNINITYVGIPITYDRLACPGEPKDDFSSYIHGYTPDGARMMHYDYYDDSFQTSFEKNSTEQLRKTEYLYFIYKGSGKYKIVFQTDWCVTEDAVVVEIYM